MRRPRRALSLATLLAATAAPFAAPLAAPLAAQPPAQLPLTPTRPLRFTTDEGTWLSVDVSPDGTTLVFDLLGDLYTLPVAGGTARRITSGQAFDAMPRFSPDGRRIAFVSDRSGASNVWVANADGTGARQVSRTDGYQYDYVSPAWTPDGRGILVSHNSGPAQTAPVIRLPSPYDLYLYSLDGGTGQRLTGTGGAAPAAPARGGGAAGGTSYLGAAFADPHVVWYSTSGATAQLFTLDLRTGTSIRRTSGRGGAVRPVLSPDRKWLVYATRRGESTALRLRELASGDERWLVPEAQRDQMGARATRDLMPGMAFTPDSRALVTAYGGKLWRVEVPSGRATPIPFTAEVDQMIGASTQFQFPLNDSTLEVRQIRVPRIAPDGKRVAFVALDRVWLADLPPAGATGVVDARNVRRLTSFPVSEYAPTWSPDGRWLAFSTWDDSTGGDVYRVRVDGARPGAPERLTTSRAYHEKLAYTPDGARLLFARTSRAERFETEELGFADPSAVHADLVSIPAGGGAATFVTRLEYLARLAPPYYGTPHFGADSGRMLLYDPSAGGGGLFSMRLDGTDRALVVRANQRPWNASGEEPAEDIVLSPRGGRAAILGAHHVFLATLPAAGAAPTLSLLGQGSGPTPLRRLTRVGGNYVGWSPDGRTLHWALGPALFLYDVTAADSAAQAGESYEPTRVNVRITVPKDRPAGTVVLRGARVVTMKGGEVIEDGDVVVRGNRIAAVGPRGSAPVPADARVIDVAGKTIVPGYVDTHAHMYALGWGLHHTEPWQYYANLAYGVTTTRDPQTGTTDVFDYADRVEAGEILGPRIFSTGPGFFVNETPGTLDEARDMLRRNADFYKSETVKAYALGDRRRRQLVAMAAQELKLSPTNEGDADFTVGLTHMLDGYAGEEHTLPVFPLYKDVVQLLARSELTYTPVLTIAYGVGGVQEYFTSRFDVRAQPKLRRFWPQSYLDLRTGSAQWRPDDLYGFPKMAADAARVAAAGGRVAVGSHGNLQGIGYHFELWGLAMGGMTPHDVLRAATLVGAQAVGHVADLGSLEPGKLADLQVLDANPLADIRNTNTVRWVMKNGRLYDAGTLDELWPRSRKLPTTQWWMASERR
jgi:Tol biopolymer transport system component/imidazolonepropionase-like amidohydrolase